MNHYQRVCARPHRVKHQSCQDRVLCLLCLSPFPEYSKHAKYFGFERRTGDKKSFIQNAVEIVKKRYSQGYVTYYRS